MLRRRADAAPRADGNVEAPAVHREAVIGREIARGEVEPGVLTWGLLVGRGPRFDGDRPAIAIESGAQFCHAFGAIGGVDEIFLARPQQVDGRAAVQVRDVDRLFGLRAVAVAAVTAAQMPVIRAAERRVSCGLWSPIQMSTRLSVTSTVAFPGSIRARGR